MPADTEPTNLEQHVMLAILWLNTNAYGISIRDTILSRSGKDYSFGSIYAALERLENKGYVKSRESEITRKPGGKKKLLFTLTGDGQQALNRAIDATDALRFGLDFGRGVPC